MIKGYKMNINETLSLMLSTSATIESNLSDHNATHHDNSDALGAGFQLGIILGIGLGGVALAYCLGKGMSKCIKMKQSRERVRWANQVWQSNQRHDDNHQSEQLLGNFNPEHTSSEKQVRFGFAQELRTDIEEYGGESFQYSINAV